MPKTEKLSQSQQKHVILRFNYSQITNQLYSFRKGWTNFCHGLVNFYFNCRNDRSCIIWRFNLEAERKLEPTLKITQSEAILTLCFNPLTHELFSGGAADFALYTPGKKEIPK